MMIIVQLLEGNDPYPFSIISFLPLDLLWHLVLHLPVKAQLGWKFWCYEMDLKQELKCISIETSFHCKPTPNCFPGDAHHFPLVNLIKVWI